MLDRSYRARLAKDLPLWRDKGWVTPEGAAGILQSLPRPGPGLGMSGIIAILGAVLLGVGVLALVAANWEAIPRLTRFGMLVGVMGAAYGTAAMLQLRGQRLFAEAAFLVAGLVFGGSIALVGQSYHLAGDFDDAVLMWALACLAAGALTRSTALLVLAAAGSAYWIGISISWRAPAPWPGVALSTAVVLVSIWVGARMARVPAILVLGFAIAAAVVTAGRARGWSHGGEMALLAAIGLAFWTGGAAAGAARDRRLADFGLDVMVASLPAALLALGLLQVAGWSAGGRGIGWLGIALPVLAATGAGAALLWRARTLRGIDALAAAGLSGVAIAFALGLSRAGLAGQLLVGCIVLAGCVWSVSLGVERRLPGARAIGLTAFAVEVIYVYLRTFGTVLDTALALLVGGALFLGLAAALFKLDRRLSTRAAASTA